MVKTQNEECLALTQLKTWQPEKLQQIKIIDVRSKEEYCEKHIPGAIHIPVDDILTSEKLFDKNDILITACGKGGGRSASAADALKKIGYNAYWLCGGTFGWFEK